MAPPSTTPFVVVDLDADAPPSVFGPFAELAEAERFGATHLSFYVCTHLLEPDDGEVRL
jgi:hypothetical protein